MKLIRILLVCFLCFVQMQAQKLTTNTYLKDNLTKELGDHKKITATTNKQQALAEKMASNAKVRLDRLTAYTSSSAAAEIVKNAVNEFVVNSNTYVDRKFHNPVDSLSIQSYSMKEYYKKKEKQKKHLKNILKNQEKIMKYYLGETAMPKSALALTEGKKIFLLLTEIESAMQVVLDSQE